MSPAILLLSLTALGAKITAPPEGTREAYEASRARIDDLRARHAKALSRTRKSADRNRVLDAAAKDVFAAITQDLLPAWYGTQWEFSGTSTTPGRGTIACGMFVGTVLRDAGFNLDRIAMGRLASEHIALSLTADSNVRRYSDRSAEEVAADLVERGEGLYLVGLDNHAGFAWVDGEKRAHFVHSSVWPPGVVVSEPLVGDNPFSVSRYRVLARLLDRPMIDRWIRGARFDARGR